MTNGEAKDGRKEERVSVGFELAEGTRKCGQDASASKLTKTRRLNGPHCALEELLIGRVTGHTTLKCDGQRALRKCFMQVQEFFGTRASSADSDKRVYLA
jgi:hypothetical protein